MENETTDIIQDIRKRCRMAMDGIISSSMRAHGLSYKLNFGVPIQKIKEISSRYIPNAILAEKLWQENTRELKILATLLYPKEEFTIDIARRWIGEVSNQEIREQLGMNLFRHLPYTYSIGLECVNNADPDIRVTGYWFLARHVVEVGDCEEIFTNKMPYLWDDILLENLFMHNAVKLFLKNVGKMSVEKANAILKKLISFRDSENPLKKEIFHNLLFEYQFYHDNDSIKRIEFV